MLAVFGIRGSVRRFQGGCCGTDGGLDHRVRVRDRNRRDYPYQVRLSIDGMTCQNCRRRVENALNSLDGVWAKVDLGQKEADVLLKAPPQRETLRAAVQRAGYTLLDMKEKIV